MAEFWENDPVAAPAKPDAWWASDPVAKPQAAPATAPASDAPVGGISYDYGQQPKEKPYFPVFDPMGNYGGYDTTTLRAPTSREIEAVGTGFVNGTPIVGPAWQSGINKTIAGAHSLVNGTPYQDELAKVQDFQKRSEAENPIGHAMGSVAGGLGTGLLAAEAAPVAFGIGKGIPLLTRMLYGGGTGATIGGADSAVRSTSEGADYAKDIGWGALLGGGLGGAGPFIGPTVGALVRAPGAATRFLGSLVSGEDAAVPGLGRAAANKLAKSVGNSGGAEAVNQRMAELGPDAMPLDASPSLQGMAKGLAIQPDTQEQIVNVLKERQLGRNARLLGDVDATIGPSEGAQTATDNITAHRTAVDSVAYPQALDNAPPIDTSNLVTMIGEEMGRTIGKTRDALQAARNYLMTERPQTVTLPDGSLQTQNVRAPQQDPNILHQVKGELDGLIDNKAPGLGVQPADVSRQQGMLKRIRGTLNDTLEAQVPGYAEANAQSHALAQRAEAVEAGTNALASGKTAPTPDELAATLNAMQPGQRAAYTKGTTAEIHRIVGTNANNMTALRGIVRGDGSWNHAKLSEIFGPEKADQILGAIDREAAFSDAYADIVKNSQTAQRTAAAADLAVRGTSATTSVNNDLSALAAGVSATTGNPAPFALNIVSRVGNWLTNGALQRADIARNQQIADVLTRRWGGDTEELMKALGQRGEALQPSASSQAVGNIAQALLAQQGGNAQRLLRDFRDQR